MPEKGLVSIITPCYNGEKVVHRLIESVLNQSYTKLEFIIVNDGSTDKSEEIILSYEPQFKAKEMIFKYIPQVNKGVGGAINTGLKHFTGEYFCWPDADDFLSPDSIEKRKDFLDTHPEYNLVRSDAFVFKEDDLSTPIGYITKKKKNRSREEGLFEDYILEKDVMFCPCHMIRTSAFLLVNPERTIFESRIGQNYQLLLPLLYKHKFAYIDEPLYNYILTSNSITRRKNDSYEKFVRIQNEVQTAITETLKRIPLTREEQMYYAHLLELKECRQRCYVALYFGRKKEFLTYFRKLKKSKALSWKERAGRLLIPFPFLIHLIKKIK